MALILLNNLPFVWLGIALLMVIIEAATMGLTTIWFALGALVSMMLAFLDITLPWQILLFLIISGILLLSTRPVAVRKLKIGKVKTNSESLIGETGVVTKMIQSMEKGQVKLKGQIWTAAAASGEELSEGCRVVVDRIEGVTLYVRREE